MKLNVRKVLARNVRALMSAQALSQEKVAERLDLTQKTISNVVNETSKVSPRLETIDQIARMFQVEPWQLLLPNFHTQLEYRKGVRSLVTNYLESTSEGKTHIQTVAEREFEYSALRQRRFPDPDPNGLNNELP